MVSQDAPRLPDVYSHVIAKQQICMDKSSNGISGSSDKLKKLLDVVYNGNPGVTGIMDDMIIMGKSEEEHDCNFLNF